jgi:ribosomal-protein-alanine N-acetyltransferase
MRIKLPLVGKSIFLRSLCEEDATNDYLSWFQDPEVIRYLEVRFSVPKSLEDLSRFIENNNKSDDTLLLGIFLLSGRHIGNIKLGPINSIHSSADIGLMIGDRNEWAKGYASLAIFQLSEFAFANLGLIKLTASCYSGNNGSYHAFLKIGFIEEGRKISQCSINQSREDVIILGKVNPSKGNSSR